MTPQSESALNEALRLAATGCPLFPCVPGAKRPLTPHGLHDATTDPDQIRDWWRRHPDANLAIPTGTFNGVTTVDVLDVDVRATGSGYPAYNRLAREGLLAGHTRAVATPSGGLHLYFSGTGQPSGRLADQHLDFKATGGYILVPPSVVDGNRYEQLRAPLPPHRALDWASVRSILAPQPALLPPRYARQARGLRPLAAWVASLPEGRRNVGTFWAACRATEQGITDLGLLIEAAVTAGLPELEARRTIASAQLRVLRAGAPVAQPATPSRPPPIRGTRHRPSA